ncbi:putative nuclease HARBI1 [Photinus pyralis]|uniref:putative nuclease HARBI1 n=1 Tax=Photinus pyralis TaxID=7054 RepID=UPI0012674181|nr:putative nuclease HARBI1 [Photinus pyralis]
MDIHHDDDLDVINVIIFGIPRQVYNRSDYFHSFDDLTFFQRFRITKPTAISILELIEPHIEYPYNLNNCVSPINQLLVFLRFCATGTHLACIGDFAGMHLSTASRIVVRVGAALASHYNRFIKMPQTQQDMNMAQMSFYEIARFPRVIGAIDCTHVKIQSPGGNDPEVFRNRKGYFSINVQAIVSAQLHIRNIVARWPGSSHDVTIFNNSAVRRQFENNLYPDALLLGDSGYYLRSYLMTPLLQTNNRAEQLYNESHIRTRNTVERFFGVFKRRFPVLAYGCRLKVQTVLTLIIALAVVHNICKEANEEDPPDPENLDRFLEILQQQDVPHIP